MRTTPGHRVTALVALAVLLGSGIATGQMIFRCQYDQVARLECCCPEENRPSGPESATLDSPFCCDIENRDVVSPPAEPASKQRRDHGAGLPAFTDPAFAQASPHHPNVAASYRATTSASPPIALLARPLLI
jgi:hypothetical protein